MATRLSKNLERKSRNRLIYTILGTIVILFVLIKYAVPALVGFSVFLANVKGSSDEVKSTTLMVAPQLNQEFSATNSAEISIKGNAAPKEEIKLYVNDNLKDTENTKDDGTYEFKNVSLRLGKNLIKAKAKKNDNESEFSDAIEIDYLSAAPSLLVETPSDGQSISKDQATVIVSGKTDSNVKVTVNDFWAVEDDSGNYSYTLSLQSGETAIRIVATDIAGNRTEKDIKVTKGQ